MTVLRYVDIGPLIVVGIVCTLAIVAAFVLVPAARRPRATVMVARVGLVGYLAAVLALTMLGGRHGGVSTINLVPFSQISGQLQNASTELGLTNIIGNVLMFVPLPVLVRVGLGQSWARGLLWSVCFSLAIEVLQLLAGRSADIDDLILNSLGALIGATFGWAGERLLVRRRPATAHLAHR